MLSREAFIKDRDYVFNKVYGALAGIAIGDSFGDAARMQENRANYQITTDFNKGASWSTDDTEFALLTAHTIIRCGGKLTTEECVKSWMEHVVTQDEYKRGGASEVEAANNLRRGILPPESGKFNTYHQSDGSAMRIGPIGILCAGDIEKAKEYARIESEISHYRDGIWGAGAVAAAVAAAMVDATMDLHDRLRTSAWATTAEAIPSAFICLKAVHDDFKKGVIVAGNFGRDADTIGAIAGAVLGAKYGANQMPERWIEKTRYPSGTCLQFTKGIDIRDYAEKITDIIMEG